MHLVTLKFQKLYLGIGLKGFGSSRFSLKVSKKFVRILVESALRSFLSSACTEILIYSLNITSIVFEMKTKFGVKNIVRFIES